MKKIIEGKSIELKNIQYMASLSEETACYSAALYVDGKRIGDVSNHGHGGCDEFHGDDKAYSDINFWCKEHLPMDNSHGIPIQPDIESVCAELLGNHLALKDMKNAFKTKFVFTKPNQDGVFEIPRRQNGKLYSAEEVAKACEGIFDKCLNLMPQDEALAIYKA